MYGKSCGHKRIQFQILTVFFLISFLQYLFIQQLVNLLEEPSCSHPDKRSLTIYAGFLFVISSSHTCFTAYFCAGIT